MYYCILPTILLLKKEIIKNNKRILLLLLFLPRYLTFCGIGIQNAQLFELSVLEYRRNQILLNLARNIFEEQNNLECLVSKIMREAKDLLKCERCAVYLLDLECGEAVSWNSQRERESCTTATLFLLYSIKTFVSLTLSAHPLSRCINPSPKVSRLWM